jgi:hypothetical protein
MKSITNRGKAPLSLPFSQAKRHHKQCDEYPKQIKVIVPYLEVYPTLSARRDVF